MRNGRTIFFITILLILTGLVLLVAYLSNKGGALSENNGSVSVVPISTTDEGDTIEVYRAGGDQSKIENKTSKYSVEIPNPWTIENQTSYQRFLSDRSLSGPDSCLFSITSFPSNGMSAEEVVNKNVELSLDISRVENAGNRIVQQYEGVLQKGYSNEGLISEEVYINRDDKIYVISAYYGGKIPSEYNYCHPQFEELLNTFEFTE